MSWISAKEQDEITFEFKIKDKDAKEWEYIQYLNQENVF